MPVPVEVVVDGVVLGTALANRYRADLATAGYGHGRHGFEFRFPAPLASNRPHMFVARRATDRAPLTGAPRRPKSAVQLKVGSSRKTE
jgi:O-antigen biosynthesis protein